VPAGVAIAVGCEERALAVVKAAMETGLI